MAGLGTCRPERFGRRAGDGGKQEYYEWRVYRLKSAAQYAPLHAYLEKAAIPMLNRIGVKTVGAFTEIDPKDGPAVHTLRAYPNLDVFAAVNTRGNADLEFLKVGRRVSDLAQVEPGVRAH